MTDSFHLLYYFLFTVGLLTQLILIAMQFRTWRRTRHSSLLTIGSSDRGSRLRLGKEGVDDRDKAAPFGVGEAPRRSTVSLDTGIART